MDALDPLDETPAKPPSCQSRPVRGLYQFFATTVSNVGTISLTASLNTARASCEAVGATGAPRQHPGDRDDQYAMHVAIEFGT